MADPSLPRTYMPQVVQHGGFQGQHAWNGVNFVLPGLEEAVPHVIQCQNQRRKSPWLSLSRSQKVREHTELNKHILAYSFYRFWLYDIVWQVMQIEHQIVTRLFKSKMERNDIIMECEDHLRDLWTYRWWLWKIPVIRKNHFIIKFNIPIMSISNRINKFFKQRQKGKNSNMSKICARPKEEHNMKDGATKNMA